jgi:hypothetical protein
MSSRMALPGFNAYAGSNGTDLDGNSRILFYNQLGCRVTKMAPLFGNFRMDATNEVDGYNEIDVGWSLRTAAGVAPGVDLSIPHTGADAIKQGTPVDAVSEAGAINWCQSYVEVASGERWPQAYLINTSSGKLEAADFNTHVDKSDGSTITNGAGATNKFGFGPIGMLAIEWEGTPHAERFWLRMDSKGTGTTFGRVDDWGGYGPVANALGGKRPYIQAGLTGTQARFNLGPTQTRQLAAMLAAGITHVVFFLGVNDLRASRTALQVAADLASVRDFYHAHGFVVVFATIPPQINSHTATPWNAYRLATQVISTSPANAFIRPEAEGGTEAQRVALSERAILNGLILAMAADDVIIVDMAAASESPSTPGKFRTLEDGAHARLYPSYEGTIATWTGPGFTVTGFSLPTNALASGYVEWLDGPQAGNWSPIQSSGAAAVTVTAAAQTAFGASPPQVGNSIRVWSAGSRFVASDGLHEVMAFINNTLYGGQAAGMDAVTAALGL